jgi:hypothetical protein
VVYAQLLGLVGPAGTTFSQQAFCPGSAPYVVNAGYDVDGSVSVQEGVNIVGSQPSGTPANFWTVSGVLTTALPGPSDWFLNVWVECSP